MLTDATKSSLKFINSTMLKYFRNQIDHAYEKVNKSYLKPYIFSMASTKTINEVKLRIYYCYTHAKCK